MLQQLLDQDVEANVVSFNAAISACEKRGEWQMARNLMNVLDQRGIEADGITLNASISSCEKGTQWPSAVLLLELAQMSSPPSMISFNATISACQKAAQWHQARTVLMDLHSLQVQADAINVGLAADVFAKSCERENLATALNYIQQSCQVELAELTKRQCKKVRPFFPGRKIELHRHEPTESLLSVCWLGLLSRQVPSCF